MFFALGNVALAAFAACSNPLGLSPATSTNVIDTITLYAVGGTSLFTPSAYAIIGRSVVYTQNTGTFDFSFNFDSLNRPTFYPTGGLPKYSFVDTVAQPGFQGVTSTFDNTTAAPTDGYETNKGFPVPLDGSVIVARSRAETCPDGTVYSLYAKIQALAGDTVAHSIQFQIVADQNCGYLSLAPGLPSS
jgi:hypothetical protein